MYMYTYAAVPGVAAAAAAFRGILCNSKLVCPYVCGIIHMTSVVIYSK